MELVQPLARFNDAWILIVEFCFQSVVTRDQKRFIIFSNFDPTPKRAKTFGAISGGSCYIE
jgi:hypothetical protein